MRCRGAIRRIGLLAIGSLAALLLSEGMLRLTGARPFPVNREQALFWTFDPVLGWRHRPGQEGTFVNYKPAFRSHVGINSRGLRDDECAYERTPGRPRILVLGDSFAWGFGVEKSETFSDLLERSIPGAEVINAGVSGYSTDQELLWFRQEGVKYRPDLVVLTFCGNDEWMNHEQLVYYIYHKPWFALQGGAPVLHGVPVPRASQHTRFVYWMRRNSALARTLLDAVAGAGGRGECGRGKDGVMPTGNEDENPGGRRSVGAGDKDAKGARQSVPLRAGVEIAARTAGGGTPQCALTRALIGEIAQQADEIGARFMILANGLAWNAAVSGGTYEEFMGTLRREGWLVLDVDSLPAFDRGRMTIPGDGHWNAAGHRFVAEEIRGVIAEKGLLGGK